MGFSDLMLYRDCPWCGVTKAHMRLEASMYPESAGGQQRHWTTLICPACAGCVLLEVTPDGEPDFQLRQVPSGGIDGTYVAHLPEDVQQYYDDAIKVLRAGVPDAAAVQLRRTLEAAAAHYDVSERVLVRSIERLISSGHVTATFGQALHLIRRVGNVGAHHTDERLDAETVGRALKFTTALLQNLFEVPEEIRRAVDPRDEQAVEHNAERAEA